ncbi:hypothetical protein KUTeg_004498 [Tegillarca granosa]|uniref:G-protein coupled receptors family 1 profile domain-containing protein n=1 Tax=Tegillarca granosa TaxID=220873 RepID=A0ABQ9FTT6_TEGGR|nr:hypothetical protein KUTeg_004498 [Tegillarca granosa]
MLLHNNTTDYVQDVLLPKYWYNIIAFTLTGTGIFGTIENIIVVVLFCRVKSLRTSTNMFIISVALSDLLMCALSKPFAIASNLAGVWIFGDSGCKFYGFLVYFLGVTSMYTLCALSFDRCIVITKPFFATNITHTVAGIIIAGCWLLGMFWAILPLIGWNSYELEVPYTSCSVVWDSKEPLRFSYNITIFFTCFCIPVTVMGYSYTMIYLTN